MQGERGKQGDHGQDGATGETGATGAKGPPIFTKMQSLVMFLFLALCFTLLAVRSEANSRNIQANADRLDRAQYAQCLARNANIARANRLYAGLIQIEKHNPFATTSAEAKATVVARIKLYNDNMLVAVDCGAKP